MSEHIFLTGITGAIGLPLAARLLSRPSLGRLTAIVRSPSDRESLPALLKTLDPAAHVEKLKLVPGDISQPGLGLTNPVNGSPVSSVIHSAAFTKFRDLEDGWTKVNVDGTQEVLRWRSGHCPGAPLIHFSTLCAAGKTTGEIPEAPLKRPADFVNGYEVSKWEAEQLVQEAEGPVKILRLATVVGNQKDGGLRRVGAFHHVLRWVYHGLLPLIPGDNQTRVDLIPTEYVTEGISRLLDSSHGPVYYHFSCGKKAPLLQELIDLCARHYSAASDAWKRGRVDAPVLASRKAFEEFRDSVAASRDLLFNQVLESVDSFLPELFYPKTFSTTSVESLFGGQTPLPPWQGWMERVITYSLRSDFGRTP